MEETNRNKKVADHAVAHAKNAADIAKGKVKSAAGKALDDPGLEVEGKLDTASGRIKQAAQTVKEGVEDQMRERRRTDERPRDKA